MTGDREQDDDPVETVPRLRERIKALADPEGRYVVACRVSGVRPEPVRDRRFETYADAEKASELAGRYRAAMRRVDPALARYDLTVSETDDSTVELVSVRERTARRRENGLPTTSQTVTLAGNGSDEWLRVENGPVVEFAGPDALLDDEFVTRQLDSKLRENR
ncbi:hypothetical protein ACFQGE_12990 [Halomicroarcula sp. GCM10025817]|uniref:DUF7552 domain-containing protein n=1 Tax=Haloarcula TaxID=2237 RepID=UPI0023E87741|nr:hypothetical protein [Halomicroarcula sp. SYNS111]